MALWWKWQIIDNDNPPEWDDDQELTNSFMTVSDLYDNFFIDNEKKFSCIGCKSKEMTTRITRGAQSYDEALCIIGEYVNITSADDVDEDMNEGMDIVSFWNFILHLKQSTIRKNESLYSNKNI